MAGLFSDDPMYMQALVDRNYSFFRAEFAELWEIDPDTVDALFVERYPAYSLKQRAEIIDLVGPFDFESWQFAIEVGVHEYWEGVGPEEMASAVTEAGYVTQVLRTEDCGVASVYVSAPGREYLFSVVEGVPGISVYEPDPDGIDLGHTARSAEVPMSLIWTHEFEDEQLDDMVAKMCRVIIYYENPPRLGEPDVGQHE